MKKKKKNKMIKETHAQKSPYDDIPFFTGTINRFEQLKVKAKDAFSSVVTHVSKFR